MTAQGKPFVTSECLGERDQLPNRRGSYKNVDDASEDGLLPAELQRRGQTGTGQRGPVDTADDDKKKGNQVQRLHRFCSISCALRGALANDCAPMSSLNDGRGRMFYNVVVK